MFKLNNMLFCRLGNLNPVRHDSSVIGTTYHSPPAIKGIYAFPVNHIERFLIGSSSFRNDRYEWVKDSNGQKVKEGQENLLHKKPDSVETEIEYYRKGKLKTFVDFKNVNHTYRKHGKTYKLTTVSPSEDDDDWYYVIIKRMKRFKHYGHIWSHLHYNLTEKEENFILDSVNDEEGSLIWIKTDISTYIKLLNREIYIMRTSRLNGGFSTTKDHLEVYIERIQSKYK